MVFEMKKNYFEFFKVILIFFLREVGMGKFIY